MRGRAYGYPAEWVVAAGRGYMAGRFSAVDLYEHEYYRSLPLFGAERFVFRYQFDRERTKLLERVAAGETQMPGSVYDPALDDKQGAFTDRDYKAYFRAMKAREEAHDLEEVAA